MFCKRTKPFAFTTILIILLAIAHGCVRRQGTVVERLGVMPIENLSSDAQFDWRSRAASAVVVYDLAGAKNIFARQVDSLSAAQGIRASRLLEGYFIERNGSIGIRATLEDAGRTKALESFEIDGPASAGFLPLANELARRLSSDARMFGTSNEQAFQFYGQALAATNPQDVALGLQQATEADRGFVAGYVDEAKTVLETGDGERARDVLRKGETALGDPIDRANLEYVRAAASGDAAGRMKALESLSATTPANANIFTELGEMRFARRQFQQAAMEYRAALRLDADSPQIWNQLGYVLAWAKDLSGAREALAHYQKLAPEDVNVLDSQGEVSYMRGDFKAGTEYFERAAAKNPAELVKAAEARLMAGDLQGADAFFLNRLGTNEGTRGVAGYQRAQWEYLTGRQKEGLSRLEKLTPELSGDLQSLAFSQLAIWKLGMGDKGAATDLANQAAARAQSPQVRGISAVCRYLASGSTASSGSKMADVLALLFAKKFQEAVPLLETLYNETNPASDGQIRTLLAWAYVETGAIDKAVPLLDTYPLPLSSGEPLFASLMFPRYLSLRKAVQQHQGKPDPPLSDR